jgi:hypothetical protein
MKSRTSPPPRPPAPPPPVPSPEIVRALTDGRAIRAAVILAEVLAPPIALR